jgi:hypothetical protein
LVRIMEAKYIQAIKAGIIGGVVIGFCIILTLIVSVITSSTAFTALGALNCCIFILIVILLVGVGALGVRMASAHVMTLNDALIVSAVAGAVAGIISAVVYVIDSILSPLLTYNQVYDIYGYSPAGMSALGAFGSICCCGPAILVISVVLAVIGGAIYAALKLKLS